MKEIRLHGRGGQGTVMAAEMLGNAFIEEGKCVACLPLFGAERRGSAVVAALRVDDLPILEKCQVYTPDFIVVTDPSLCRSPGIYSGLKAGATALLNTPFALPDKPHEHVVALACLDAMGIALQEIKVPIVNTTMVGAFARVSGWLSLESVLTALGKYFTGDQLSHNRQCAARGFEEVKVFNP